MVCKYYQCKCGMKECNFGFRVTSCLQNSTSDWFLAQGGLHPFEIIVEEEGDDGVPVIRPHQKPKKKYGIAMLIKLLINGNIYF